MLMSVPPAAPGAGGAAFDEILIASAMAGAVILAFGWVTLRERQGHRTLVGRLADKIAEIDGLPRWAGLPSYLCVISLLCAGFGVWWDVPIHMQNGRDEGPLANPSHYFIFLGILGFLHAGILSMALARDPLPRRTIRISRSWRAPLGAFPMFGAGLIALMGFPADDAWHRIFGQDVTEWGPTHVMMIGGAVTCCLGIPLLYAEAYQVGARGTRTLLGRLRMAISIALCLIPIAFLMEFDLGVPQFPAATEFIIFAFVATWICTAVRNWVGPGGALLAAALYLVIHAFLYLTVTVPLDDVLPARFLLFVPSAVLVELVALVANPRRKPLAFALASGVLVGTLGMYAEWLWSDYFMPLPQPFDAGALPLLLGVATVSALGGGLVGGWHVARLREVAGDPAHAEASHLGAAFEGVRRQWAGTVGLLLFLAMMAIFAPPSAGSEKISATVTYTDVESVAGGEVAECPGTEDRCEAVVTIDLDQTDVLDDAIWFYALSWQGRGPGGHLPDVSEDPVAQVPGVVRVAMEPTGVPGQWRSSDPVPLYGNWKTMLRIHKAPTTMLALPLYAPDDPAIASARGRAVRVADGATIGAVTEREFLQRETKDDLPDWLFGVGYALVICSWLLLLAFFGWCYSAAARGASGSPVEEPEAARA